MDLHPDNETACKCEVNVSDIEFDPKLKEETEQNPGEGNNAAPPPEQNLIDPEIEGNLGQSEDEDEMGWKSLGLKYSKIFGGVKNVLIDIEGTLYRDSLEGITIFPGVIKGLQALRKYNLNICLITNSYKGSKNDICRSLKSIGIKVSPKEIFTSADVCRKTLRVQSKCFRKLNELQKYYAKVSQFLQI